MDGSTVDHSDSDSGESWTLLDHSPAYGEDAPEFTENKTTVEQVTTETHYIEKDEDTDGISVISDSEPESATPCETNYEKSHDEESRPTELSNPQFISVNPITANNNNRQESIRSEDDFLGDNTGKHKTYVHRRNKRLSTVLNIIMLGSVITAAGVAIGHMWGARNECSMHTTPSINKILSNLYKLQEENTYLRNKLKELTLVSSIQMQQRKLNSDKIPFKQQRCKKIYEEPLNSKNTERITKCIDNENNNVMNSHVIQPEYEKEFLSDIEKLKNIYQQNKSWLDDEVAKRMRNEEKTFKKMLNNMKTPLSSIIEEQKVLQDENMKEKTDFNSNTLKTDAAQLVQLELNPINDDTKNELPAAKKVTYADSLKSAYKIQKRDTNVNLGSQKENRDHIIKRKIKKDIDTTYDILSEEELKKDDRYAGPKMKQDKKKRDRQKLHKKQKRRNKYEQWEMKGGYLKDYDEFSISSSQENEYILKKPDRNILSRDFEKRNYINQFSENNDDQNNNSKNENEKTMKKQSSKGDKPGGKNIKNEDLNWYDKRAVLRTEARKRLEHELFGETTPNNAGWYFRRMQRREQCRAKGDNSTHKKLSRRNMNFKMKH